MLRLGEEDEKPEYLNGLIEETNSNDMCYLEDNPGYSHGTGTAKRKKIGELEVTPKTEDFSGQLKIIQPVAELEEPSFQLSQHNTLANNVYEEFVSRGFPFKNDDTHPEVKIEPDDEMMEYGIEGPSHGNGDDSDEGEDEFNPKLPYECPRVYCNKRFSRNDLRMQHITEEHWQTMIVPNSAQNDGNIGSSSGVAKGQNTEGFNRFEKQHGIEFLNREQDDGSGLAADRYKISRKGIGGRYKKLPIHSSYKMYAHADMVRFVRLVEFYPQLYDRLDVRAQRSDENELLWQSIERECGFLKLPANKIDKGKNALVLWMEIVNDMKKEERRLANLPADSTSSDSECKFTLFEELDFMRAVREREKLSQKNEDSVNNGEDMLTSIPSRTAPTWSRSTEYRKRKRKGDDMKLNRLLELIEMEYSSTGVEEEKPKLLSPNQDLYYCIDRLLETVPEVCRFALKAKIFNYVKELRKKFETNPPY